MRAQNLSTHELAAKYNVSVKLIRRMIQGGDLQRQGKDDPAAEIRARLSNDDVQLSVEQLLGLLGDRRIIHDLGRRKDRAREQLGLLGDVRGSAAPPHVTACIRDAARGDPESVTIIMAWIKTVLPPRGVVRYQWVGVRLLIGRWPNLRKSDFNYLARAMDHVCAHPDFKEWWSKITVGSQNPRVFHRPKLKFDL